MLWYSPRRGLRHPSGKHTLDVSNTIGQSLILSSADHVFTVLWGSGARIHISFDVSFCILVSFVSALIAVAPLVYLAKCIEQDLELFPLAPRDSLALRLKVSLKSPCIGE